jgi:hypothetical protein
MPFLTWEVHSRHFCGLSANQSASSLSTTFRDTFDDLSGNVNFKLAASVVVQKVQWLSTLDEKIVDGHGDEINAYRGR